MVALAKVWLRKNRKLLQACRTVDAVAGKDFANLEIISSSKEEQRTALKRFSLLLTGFG